MKNMIDEFKEFALKGNLIELAVAFILSLAFSAVVTALVNGVVLQLIRNCPYCFTAIQAAATRCSACTSEVAPIEGSQTT